MTASSGTSPSSCLTSPALGNELGKKLEFAVLDPLAPRFCHLAARKGGRTTCPEPLTRRATRTCRPPRPRWTRATRTQPTRSAGHPDPDLRRRTSPPASASSPSIHTGTGPSPEGTDVGTGPPTVPSDTGAVHSTSSTVNSSPSAAAGTVNENVPDPEASSVTPVSAITGL